jgi:hypothetical protein
MELTNKLLPTLALLGALVYAAGFTCGPTPEDPCVDDARGCAEGDDGFVIDPDCTLEGDLDAELGWGDNAFVPLADGDTVEPRLLRASLDVSLRPGGCSAEGAGAGSGEGTGEGTGSAFCEPYSIGSRTLTLGGDQTPRLLEDGTLEEYGLLVFLDTWSSELPKTITLEVEDTCGRAATVVRSVQ